MTVDEARTRIAEQFSGAQVEGGTPLVVSIPVDAWLPFAHFAKTALGCRFFAFLTAVDWKEQGLEVVYKADNLDDHLWLLVKTRLGPGVSECPSNRIPNMS
jgi:NADH:ubiquinone oxidoreductase subunit C